MPRRGWALLALPLLLAGCTAATWEAPPAVEASSPASSSSASPSADPPVPTPSPSPDTAPVVVTAEDLPTDCRALVDDETYRSTFGDVPLNDPLVVGDRPVSGYVYPVTDAPTDVYDAIGLGARLLCTWRDPAADVSYLSVTVSVVDTITTSQLPDLLAAGGYTCTARDGGEQCQLIGEHPLYPVREATTYFTRDDIVLVVSQANVPTDDLMGSLIDGIWGA